MPYKFNPFTGTFDDSTAGPAGTVSAAGSGTAALPGIAFASDPNTGIYNPGADQLAVSTGGTGRLFVDANGFVGIGAVNTGSTGAQLSTTTTSSTARLIVASTNAAGYTGLRVANGTGHWEMQVDGANQGLRWLDDGSERLRITSAGLVGIGTSSPGATLEVAGSARFFGGSGTDGLLTIGSTGASNDAVIIKYDNANDRLQFYNWGASAPNQNTFVIDNANSRVGIGTSSPVSKINSVLSQADNAAASNTTLANSFLHLGGGEYGLNRYFLTTYGYSTGRTNSGAFIGAIGASASGFGKYDLVFGTRDVTTDTAPDTRMIIKTDGKVGIGTTSPTTPLEIASSGTTNALISAFDATASRAYYQVGGTTSGRYTQIGTDTSTTFINDYFGTGIAFQLAASEKARIDSSGRLLVGTSTARSNIQFGGGSAAAPTVQIETAVGSRETGLSVINNSSGGFGGLIRVGSSAGATVGSNDLVGSGTYYGILSFVANDGTNFVEGARISAVVDGTSSTGDLPTRLEFSTTADGASSPTERMRIKSAGTINFSNVSTYADNTAALAGGLVAGDVYRKSDGTLMITY